MGCSRVVACGQKKEQCWGTSLRNNRLANVPMGTRRDCSLVANWYCWDYTPIVVRSFESFRSNAKHVGNAAWTAEWWPKFDLQHTKLGACPVSVVV